MKTLKKRIAELSSHLQSLMAPEIFPDVQQAVERNDKNSLINVCRKAKVPEMYLTSVTSVLLSVSPDQKWPGIM